MTRRYPSSRDAMPSPGSIEFGTVTGLILERLKSPRRRPCRPRLGYLRRQAGVSHDSLHHRRLFNQGHEAQPSPAARTRQDIVIELRFFGGLTVEETAQVLQTSPQTVMREWRLARAWLARELSQSSK